ncbi:hypothetical protein NQ117_18335 [Paenibacillus sp. SC116]|uniref:hypothetical protein n=1 Tax=Paenibacillus sp. SC116 TaxID=2968986 RepID=UPI00215A92F8|nr:hypothetical protein [Paenibacillus sp. SC116]MCR8845646.1 hypothetical protein [Paenibacillus sp. SC116]
MVEFIFVFSCVLIFLYPLQKASQNVKSGLQSDKKATQLKLKLMLFAFMCLIGLWYFYFSFNEEHAQFLINIAIVHLGLLSFIFIVCMLGSCYLLSIVVVCLAIFFSYQYHVLISSMPVKPGGESAFAWGLVFAVLITLFVIIIGIIIEELYKWLRTKYKQKPDAA